MFKILCSLYCCGTGPRVQTSGVVFDPLWIVTLYCLPRSVCRHLLHYRTSNRIQDGGGVREHAGVLKATFSASVFRNLEFSNVRVQLIARPVRCRL
jgi:hypothetical protein